jgi:hypothetical protein
MSTALANIGSKLLARLLPQEEAGACTRCPGPCQHAYRNICYSNGQYWYSYCPHYYTCDCGCQPDVPACTKITYLGQCP